MSLGTERDFDERGNKLKSHKAYFIQCKWCNGNYEARYEGRPPTFCSAGCRKEMARAKRELDNAQADLKHARHRLARAEDHWNSHGGNLATS